MVVGAVSAVVAWFAGRHKTEADATDIITQAAGRMVQQMSERMDALADEVAQAHKELGELRLEVLALRDMVRALGGNPDHWRGWPL
jgi:hypothetical protein